MLIVGVIDIVINYYDIYQILQDLRKILNDVNSDSVLTAQVGTNWSTIAVLSLFVLLLKCFPLLFCLEKCQQNIRNCGSQFAR